MKVLTSKIVNGKKMFLIEDNNPQGKVFAQDGKPIKKENISNYNPYYVDVKGLNASESTKTNLTPATKITPQEIKKIKESPTNVGNIKIKEAQEKAQRLKEAEEAYKKRKAGAPITPELLAQETQAIGDKISLQNIPGVGQYIPDVLDITGGIGSMASGLGRIPLNIKNKEYGQAALSVAMPLGVGALAGVGTQNTGQFVNNLANPLAGTGDLVNNLGNKYLPNAYKLNPFAFKPNPEMMYRGIGEEGMKDALESGVFRAKQNVQPSLYGRFDMSKQFKSTYYTPKFNTADQYGKGFIAEVPKDVTTFRLRYKGKGDKTWSQIADEEIPIDKGRILKKDWLKGYKEIEVPKSNFKSEIDWGKWNKEIPENKALMQEYNTIEQNLNSSISEFKSLENKFNIKQKELWQDYKSGKITGEDYSKQIKSAQPWAPFESPIFPLEKQLRELSVKKEILNTPQKNILKNEQQLGKNISDGGTNNKGVFELNDNYVARLSAHGYDDASRLLNYNTRIKSPRIMKTQQVKELNGKVFQVQDKAIGKPYTQLSETELKNLPKEHIDNFYKDIAELEKNGLSIDISGGKSNIFYDSKKGFQFIDLGIGKMPNIDDINKVVNFKNPVGNFKSEINWGKWNKEIPENKALMQEYNAIEQTSKANDSWMKNPDGSSFQGTPEQFVQQNSSNFKKAYPDGFENVYRGVNFHNNEFPEKAIFTGNKNLAKKYTNTVGKENFLTSESHNLDAGVYNLAHKKSTNSIELNFNKDKWTDLPLKDKKTIINTKKKEFENYIKEVEENIKETPSLNDVLTTNKLKNIKKYKEELKALKALKENDPKVIKILQDRLGSKTSTDDLAKYAEQYNVDNIKLNNINDGGLGDVSIINNKKGNYLKSLIGNNGMFDMTNPNIYKTLIPGAMTLGALNQTNEKQFGGTIKVLDTKIEKNKKYYLINE